MVGAEQEFPIDGQAARIKVGRADVDDVIKQECFCVKDLRLVFVNLDAAPEESAVERQPGEAHERDIRFSSEYQPHLSAAPGGSGQLDTQPARRQKIGAGDPNVAGVFEVTADGIAQRIVSEARTEKERVNVGSARNVPSAASPVDAPLLQVRAG